MRIHLLLFIFLSLSIISIAQVDYSSLSIEQLNSMKAKAASNENYDEAARCKKAIDLKNELNEVLKKEDYERAAEIKKELAELNYEGNKTLNNENPNSLANMKELEDIPEVTYYNTVVVLKNNNVFDLEQQTGTIQTRAGGFAFYYQATSSWKFTGKRSPVTLEKDDRLIVRLHPSINPHDFIKFAKLDVIGRVEKNRFLPIQTTGAAAVPFGAVSKTNKHDDNYIGVRFKQLEESYYEIMFDDILIPGEYGFLIMGNKINAFSVKETYSNNGVIPKISDIEPDEIYALPSFTYYGIDFSQFTYVATSKSVSVDRSQVQNWITQSREKLSMNQLKGWFKKENVVDQSVSAESVFGKHATREWLSDIPNNLLYSDIQKILDEYPKGEGLGLMYVVENMYHEREKMEGFFVWFDCETKAIVNIKFFDGNGERIDRWGYSFPALIDYYADRKYIPIWESYR